MPGRNGPQHAYLRGMTDKQFQICEDKIDAMRRRARRSPEPLDAETIASWDAAFALPQIKAADRKVRDAAMDAVATKYGLVR